MKTKFSILFLVVLLGSFQQENKDQKFADVSGRSMRVDNVVDIDGKVYKTVVIGGQEWMAEDLEVKHYNNGDPIPFIKCDKNFDKQLSESWNATKEGAYTIVYKPSRDCFVKNGRTSLILYNWNTVNDSRGLAPKGWHIPSQKEWEELIAYLGGDRVAGTVLKSINGWDEKYASNGNNISGFNALPTGVRNESGFLMGYSQYAWYWTSEPEFDYFAHSIQLGWQADNNRSAIVFGTDYRQSGMAIRCIKDE